MDVPELRHNVGQYLSRHDLTICARVNKAWSATFLPLIYEVLDTQCSRLSPTAIKNHGKHIKTLGLLLPLDHFDLFASSTRCVRTLTIETWTWRYNTDPVSDFTRNLITNNPGLRVISIDNFRGINAATIFPRIAQACPQLETIKIIKSTLDYADLVFLLRDCTRLRDVNLDECELTNTDIVPVLDLHPFSSSVVTFQANLVENFGINELVPLLKVCLKLEQLLVRFPMKNSAAANDWSKICPCPNLSNLTIASQDLIDSTAATVFRQCPKLKYVSFGTARLGTAGFQALQGHLHAMTSLHLAIDSRFADQVLSSCPNLLRLKGVEVDVDKVFTGSPDSLGETEGLIEKQGPHRWVCLGLQLLDIHIKWSLLVEKNKPMLNWLMALRELETITIKTTTHNLSHLAIKSDPTKFWMKGTYLRSRFDQDLDWQLQTWPKLKTLTFNRTGY